MCFVNQSVITLGLTAITAIAALISSFLSYVAIRAQKKISERSIKVAEDNVRASIDNERPWIVVRPAIRASGVLPSWAPGQIHPPAPPAFKDMPIIPAFSGTYINIGKSVAEITGLTIRYVRLQSPVNRLPDVPEYSKNSSTKILAAPGEAFAFGYGLETKAPITADDMQALKTGIERWYAYGKISYKDNHARLHLTRFIYRYKHPEDDSYLTETADAFEPVPLAAYMEAS